MHESRHRTPQFSQLGKYIVAISQPEYPETWFQELYSQVSAIKRGFTCFYIYSYSVCTIYIYDNFWQQYRCSPHRYSPHLPNTRTLEYYDKREQESNWHQRAKQTGHGIFGQRNLLLCTRSWLAPALHGACWILL